MKLIPSNATLTTMDGLAASTMGSSGADVRVREAEHGLGVGDVVADAADRGCSYSPKKHV